MFVPQQHGTKSLERFYYLPAKKCRDVQDLLSLLTLPRNTVNVVRERIGQTPVSLLLKGLGFPKLCWGGRTENGKCWRGTCRCGGVTVEQDVKLTGMKQDLSVHYCWQPRILAGSICPHPQEFLGVGGSGRETLGMRLYYWCVDTMLPMMINITLR